MINHIIEQCPKLPRLKWNPISTCDKKHKEERMNRVVHTLFHDGDKEVPGTTFDPESEEFASCIRFLEDCQADALVAEPEKDWFARKVPVNRNMPVLNPQRDGWKPRFIRSKIEPTNKQPGPPRTADATTPKQGKRKSKTSGRTSKNKKTKASTPRSSHYHLRPRDEDENDASSASASS